MKQGAWGATPIRSEIALWMIRSLPKLETRSRKLFTKLDELRGGPKDNLNGDPLMLSV